MTVVWHALWRGLMSLGAALWPQGAPADRCAPPESGPPPGHPERMSPPSAEERELWHRLVD